MDEIDRILLHDDEVRVSPRFVANVMAEVRAAAQPAPRTIPWREILPRFATCATLAAAGSIACTQIDVTILARAARELTAAGAIIGGGLAAIYLPRLTDTWD